MSDTKKESVKDLLEYIGKSMVSHPEDFSVQTESEDSHDTFLLHVHEDDFGQIIGRRGRTARALRIVASAAAARLGREASVEIVE